MNKAVFFHTWHKKMWDLLAEHPEWDTEDAVEALRNAGYVTDDTITNDCFACHAQQILAMFNNTDCKPGMGKCNTALCPLDWGQDSGNTAGCAILGDGSYRGLYFMWRDAGEEGNMEERVRLARQIRDLPLREGAYNTYYIF